MAQLLGETTDANNYSRQMNKVKEGIIVAGTDMRTGIQSIMIVRTIAYRPWLLFPVLLNKINIRISLTCLRSNSMLVRTWRNMLWKHSL